MKTAILFLLGGVAGFGPLSALVFSETPPVDGKALLLDNDILIEGDIRRVGNQYHIRRGSGETIIPASRVIEVVADRRQAYQVMRERSNPRDLDERLRLIRWAMEQNLRDEALADAEVLLKFRPENAQVRTLVDGLRSLKTATKTAVPAPAEPTRLPESVVEIDPPDYNPQAFGTFVSRVQPILMNTCANCHVAGPGGSFKLVRAVDGSNRKGTLFNLASTLKQLKRGDLSNSLLLTKAVSPHGKALKSPLRDREALAFQYLEAWAIAAVGSDVAPANPPVLTTIRREESKREPKNPAPKKSELQVKFGETSDTRTKPEPQIEAKDQFDPAIFNGTIQPKK